MINISTVAFQARKTLRSSGLPISQTHALELVASLFGYGTYAALTLDPEVETDQICASAEDIVLRPDHLPKRMIKLGLDPSHAAAIGAAVVEACRLAVGDDNYPTRIHASMNDFKDFIFVDVGERAAGDDDVSSAYAETNAYIDEFYTDDYEFEPLVAAETEWVLVASGTHTGEIDPERPYSGHAGNFTATYTFRKEGRCGLALVDVEFGIDF